jgi:hypothetical protein
MKQIPIPIEWNETFEFLDSSKMKELARCPRKFFYRYILGFTSNNKSIHPVFGSALHLALEYLYQNGLEGKNLPIAMELFKEEFYQDFPEIVAESFAPKSPSYAYKALEGYIKFYGEADSRNYEVLDTELNGEFFISTEDPTRTMTMKLDVALKDKKTGKIVVMDHKTSQVRSSMWTNSWILDLQMNNYLLGAIENYGEDKVTGIIVNGLFFTKTKTGSSDSFIRIPVLYDAVKMVGHLATINWYYDLYEHYMQKFSEAKENDLVLNSFPRNPTACGDYGGCPYHSICQVVENPLKLATKQLTGFKKEYWNPRNQED